MRLEDESAVIREAVPAEYIDVVVAITQLGGTTVPMFVLAVLFWVAGRHRRRTALVVSYAFAGLGFLLALKALLGLPRPPEDVVATAADLEMDKYGFPSGHAFAATVIYGGLCAAFDRTRDSRALFAVGTIVVAVALSRVVLGVHYLGDVIVGAALGVAFLAAMNRVTRGDPTTGFAIAVCFAIPALVVTGAGEEALLGVGGSIGGLLATYRLEEYADPAPQSRLEGVALAAVGVGGIVAIRAIESLAGLEPVLAALSAVLVGWVFVAPIAVRRVSTVVLEFVPARA